MLNYMEKKYGDYKQTEAEEKWLFYFVNTYLGGTDIQGRKKTALYDHRSVYYDVFYDYFYSLTEIKLIIWKTASGNTCLINTVYTHIAELNMSSWANDIFCIQAVELLPGSHGQRAVHDEHDWR